MHLLVPFASADSEACAQVLGDLALPHLGRLLALMTETRRDDGDAYSFSPPHERALAAAWGWRGGDGALPFAAHAAEADGIDVAALAWGQLTPCHWHLGRDHVSLLDPAGLALAATESRDFFAAVDELFASEGFVTAWGAAGRWYVARDDLQGLATASLDRAIGRNVDLWLREAGGAAATPAVFSLVRRLQSEMQLLLYEHPVNAAREELGALAVNSFWLSGCGRAQRTDSARTPRVDASLRDALLHGDWVAWADAWRALDAGPLRLLLDEARARGAAGLTLCGERSSATFELRPRPAWQRFRDRFATPDPRPLLQGL